jgi:transcriptional regulator GlxA family with amidase domain
MRRRSERGSPHFRASVEPIREVLSMRNIVPKDPRIQRALDLLQENRPQSDNVAMALNLSASRFRHLFKEELGISPHHYLLCARLHRARELLENSFLTVKEIAALVGVNDLSHFVRDYKTLFNETPTETRTRSRRASE